MKKGIINGSKPAIVADSGAISNCGRMGNLFIPIGVASFEVFDTSLSQVLEATEQATLMHMVREPARTVNMVPGLKQNSLLSVSTFADANYILCLCWKK